MKNLSDKELISRCKEYGSNARTWLRKFGKLLPEVASRGLHRKKGFQSIHQFAAVYAGMSKDMVDRILRTEQRLKGTNLWGRVEEIGWTKLQAIATVVEKKSEEEWKEVAKMPKAVVQTLVKKLKAPAHISKSVLTQTEQTSQVPHEVPPKLRNLSFHVDAETELEFKKLKLALEKEKGQSMTFGEVLKELLNNGDTKNNPVPGNEIGEQKQAQTEKRLDSIPEQSIQNPKSRHIPARLKRQLLNQTKGKCANSFCNEPATEFHHQIPWSHQYSHQSLTPLCHKCHQLNHAGLVKHGQIQTKLMPTSIDRRVQQFWKPITASQS